MNKEKLLFIHIPKTAGISIYKYSLQNKVDITCFGHEYARNLLKSPPRKDISKIKKDSNIKKYFSFSFVRNPYDKFLSSFYFYKKNEIGNKEVKKEISKFKTFKDFCLNFSDFKYHDDKQFINQYVYVYSKNNIQIVDYIGKFETLEKDLEIIYKLNNYNYVGNIPVLNKTEHKEWIYEYDDKCKEFVYEKYIQDFIYFNYNK